MKKSIVLALAVLLIGFQGFSQTVKSPKLGFKPTYLGVSTGPFADTYFQLDLDQLESRIDDANYERLDLTGYDSYNYAVTNAGMSMNLLMRYGTSSRSGFYKEKEAGLSVVAGREILIDYYDDDLTSFKSITFCDMQNEVSILGLHRVGYSFGNLFKIYSGIGASLGTSIGSQFWVFNSSYHYSSEGSLEEDYYNEDVYSTRSSLFGRVYAPLGAELVILNKLSLGAETRLGYGRQQVLGGKSYGGVNYALQISAGWNF